MTQQKTQFLSFSLVNSLAQNLLRSVSIQPPRIAQSGFGGTATDAQLVVTTRL
jgi:hypothetical protein